MTKPFIEKIGEFSVDDTFLNESIIQEKGMCLRLI